MMVPIIVILSTHYMMSFMSFNLKSFLRKMHIQKSWFASIIEVAFYDHLEWNMKFMLISPHTRTMMNILLDVNIISNNKKMCSEKYWYFRMKNGKIYVIRWIEKHFHKCHFSHTMSYVCYVIKVRCSSTSFYTK